jgi:biotin carboxyl carrier protein
MWRFLACVAMVLVLLVGGMYWFGVWPFDAPATAVETPDGGLAGEVHMTAAMKGQERGPSASRPMPLLGSQPFKDPISVSVAQLAPIEEAEVPSRFDGKVSEILVDLNLPVRRGQPLVRLDDRMAQTKEDAAAIKAESIETIEAAKAKYETASKIVDDDRLAGAAVSKNDKDIHEFQKKQAWFDYKKAILDRDIARHEYIGAKAEREFHRISSPISGVVAKLYKKDGEGVRAGEPVCKVANFDRLRVEGTVPAQQAPYIKVGMRCIVEPEWPLAELNELRGHTKTINSLAVTPDRLLLASASEDQTVILYDWGRGRRWDTLVDDVPLYAVAAGRPLKDESSGETTYSFLTGGANGRIRLWLVTANAEGRRVGKKDIQVFHDDAHHGGAIKAVAFSPDGKLFATGGDRSLCLWKLDGSEVKFQYQVQESSSEPAHRGSITTLQMSQDANSDLYLVSAGTDRSLKRWKLGDKFAELDFRLKDRTNDVPKLGVSQDGQKCLFDAGDKLWVIDFNERDIVGTIDSGGRGHFSGLALFTPSGQMVLTANSGGRVQLFTMPASPSDAAFFRHSYAEGFRRNSLLALGVLGACASEDSLLMVPGALASCCEQPKQAPPPEVSAAVPTLSPAAHLVFPTMLVNSREYRGLTAVPEVWPLQAYELRHLVPTRQAAALTCAAFVPEPPGYEGRTILFTGDAEGRIHVWQLPPASERANALEAIITAVGSQVETGNDILVRAEFDNPNAASARLFARAKVNLTIYPEMAGKK